MHINAANNDVLLSKVNYIYESYKIMKKKSNFNQENRIRIIYRRKGDYGRNCFSVNQRAI
jgi:hypothetical protein